MLIESLIICLTMMAGSITTEQAEEIARRFVSSKGTAMQGQRMRMAARRQLPLHVAHNASAFYVFNVGTDDGYVMVSGSDLTPQVLGYADRGSFDEQALPANMKAWIDGYADQIAYIEQTQGSHEAPVPRRSRTPVAPLLTSTWDQDEPYNNRCPEYKGKHSMTGCAATALAQVLNYHKYPAQTVSAIPAYTTTTHSIAMPEIPVTTIDWDNMLDSYSGSETDAQKNAVAQLMLLCGQSLQMDYTPDESGTKAVYYAQALTHYFGYEDVSLQLREAFSTSEWETMIYNEIANNRPVLYNGQTSRGGHAFVVDGCDADGLFHVNWGWSGQSNGYFLLSVLNPYNNEAIGSSSSRDGYSFSQNALTGIRHSTGGKLEERLLLDDITNDGDKSYTRTSAAADFSGMKVTVKAYNSNSGQLDCQIGLALCDASGSMVKLLGSQSRSLAYIDEATCTFSSISFGSGLSDGIYYIVPVCKTATADDWKPCWGSSVNRITATVSGLKLTLTEPTASLSGTIAATGNKQKNTTVNLQAQITNSGTYFNGYVYLLVNNSLAGGRIFEAEVGATVTFDIDYTPTTTGIKHLTLAYRTNTDYVPIATSSMTVTSGADDQLLGSITVTNANSAGNIEGSTVNFTATFTNISDRDFSGYLYAKLYQYDNSLNQWVNKATKNANTTIAVGSSGTLTETFGSLEAGGMYYLLQGYSADGIKITDIEEGMAIFNVVAPTAVRTIRTGSQPFDVYTTTGYKVRRQVTSLRDLPAGIYIVNGRKVAVK